MKFNSYFQTVMNNWFKLILPILIGGGWLGHRSGVLDMSIVEIIAHELKHTELNYEWHYKDGDVFTSSQTVSTLRYEDALLSMQPDYAHLLSLDLELIAQKRDPIKHIDPDNLILFTSDYGLKICLEDVDIHEVDSTLFTKIVKMNVLGAVELYDKDQCALLYANPLQKFNISNTLIINGFSSREFLDIKIKELWISQLSSHIKGYIRRYEEPDNYIPWRYRNRKQAVSSQKPPIERAVLKKLDD